jgi:hypothetical protein
VLNRLKETLLNELVAGGPVLGTPGGADPATTARRHPEPGQLEGFVRGGLPRLEARAVVRHLLRGCDECRGVVRHAWALGNRESIEADNEPERKTS